MNLDRFLIAQENMYETAKMELMNGRKETHWMWYIFPQLKGLGKSAMADYYGIQDKQEACEYAQHPILGNRLRELTDVLLALPCHDPQKLMGFPDDLKLRSCMTLFWYITKEERFYNVLLYYFYGKADEKTIERLKGE